MRVYTICSECNLETSIFIYAPTRVDLKMEKGEEIEITCNRCQHKITTQVSNLYAKPSRTSKITAGLIFIISLAGILWLTIGQTTQRFYWHISIGLLITPIVAYGIIREQDRIRVSAFNNS